jgi:hypothetical protein
MLLSGSLRYGSAAKIPGILLALAGLLVLPGCWVSSINGLSEALFGTDKDQTYDPALLGKWTASSDDCVTTLNVTAEGKDYHWKVTTEGAGCVTEKSRPEYYVGQLFKLGDHKFLDLTARPQDVCEACLAVHWILKVEANSDSFSLIAIDSDWLENAEKLRMVTLSTLPGGHDTLTASPEKLKQFCRTYADDQDVFKPDSADTFERKQPEPLPSELTASPQLFP